MSSTEIKPLSAEQLLAIDPRPLQGLLATLQHLRQTYHNPSDHTQHDREIYVTVSLCEQMLFPFIQLLEFARTEMPTPDHQSLIREWVARGQLDMLPVIPEIMTKITELPGQIKVPYSHFEYRYTSELEETVKSLGPYLKSFTPSFCRQLAAFTGEDLPAFKARANLQPALEALGRRGKREGSLQSQATELTQKLRAIHDFDLTPKAGVFAASKAWLAEWERTHAPLFNVITQALEIVQDEGPDLGDGAKAKLYRYVAEKRQHQLDERYQREKAEREQAKTSKVSKVRKRAEELPPVEKRRIRFYNQKGETKESLPGLVTLSLADEARIAANQMQTLMSRLHNASDPTRLGSGDDDLLEIGKAIGDAYAVCRHVQILQQESGPRAMALRELMGAVCQEIDRHLANGQLKDLVFHARHTVSEDFIHTLPPHIAVEDFIADADQRIRERVAQEAAAAATSARPSRS